MNLFITGGTGFIGTHLMRLLQDSEYELQILILEEEDISKNKYIQGSNIVRGNLANTDNWIDQVKRFRPDVTLHMAWEGIPQYDAYTSMNNLMNSLNLITKLSEIGCKRIICTGSCWEYGQTQGKLIESIAPQSTNAFTAAKNALHMMGSEIAHEHDASFIWTRLFYVYGPLQRSYSLIPSIIKNIQKGKNPEIKTPHAKNDFIYVEDVVRALDLIIQKCTKSAVYNIGSGYSTSIHEIVDLVCQYYDVSYSTVPNDNNEKKLSNFWADVSKIKNDTGWKPQVTIENGIQKMVDFYKSNTKLLVS